jgi:putative ABC transport system ATP-binding protein
MVPRKSCDAEDNDGVLFEVEGVHVRRGRRVVFGALELEIAEGATAVVGPSGVGKSTLLRLLNRLADPDGGVVRFHGRDLRELDVLELRREVALVPQLPALMDGTVAEAVTLGVRLAGRPPVDVEELLALAGLGRQFAPRSAARLSVGEQQRIMLARALALRPRVLLLDEPTSALDADARGAVEDTLLDLRRTLGVSLVFVTHDRAQAERIGERVLQLADATAAVV